MSSYVQGCVKPKGSRYLPHVSEHWARNRPHFHTHQVLGTMIGMRRATALAYLRLNI